MDQLTEREREILRLIGEGFSNREIASRLAIKLSTVKWYVRKIYAHLGLNNRTEAVAWGIEHDIVQQKQSSLVPNNLPVSLTPFIGRQAELAQLDRFFYSAGNRLVTLIASGGIGKSRLALSWAEQQLVKTDLFPDGVFFISLAPLTQSNQIALLINQTIGFFPERTDPRSAEAQLVGYLHDKKLLLVLDNFEHLLDGATLISTILHEAELVHVLVTSRERLRLYGEQLFQINGLSYPVDLHEDDIINRYPAVELFLRSAQRFQYDLNLSADIFPHIVKICQLVDGMPLALELAAGWVESTPIPDIAQSLSQGYELLETDMQDVPDRQRSIWAVFDETWKQLNRPNQLIFAKLSVFKGAFTQEAAESIAQCTKADLQSLADKSLVQDQGARWYRVHELLRQFGTHKLAKSQVKQTHVDKAHARFYMNQLIELTPKLFTHQQYDVLESIERQFENIKKGWLWFVDQQAHTQLEAAADGLGYFCDWCGFFEDGQALFSSFAELENINRGAAWLADFINIHGDTAKAEDLLNRILQKIKDQKNSENRSIEAFAYQQKGWLIFGHNSEQGRQLFQQSLDLYKSLNDEWGQAEASFGLGRVLHDMGQFDEALRLYTNSITIRKRLGDRRGQALLLNWMSNTAVYQGRAVDGVTLAMNSVKLCRELGEKLLLTNSLARLGANLVWQGKYSEARELQTETLELYKQMGNRAKLPRAYTRLSVTEMGVGDLSSARSHAQIGLELAKKIDDQTVIGFALWVLGYVEIMESADMFAGYELFQESVRINRAVGQKSEMCWAIGMMGYTAECLGRLDESKALYIEALQVALEIQDFFGLLQGMMGIVFWLAKIGEFEKMAEVYGLVSSYPMLTSARWHESNTAVRFEEMAKQRSADEIEKHLAKGRQLELGATAVQLLSFLSQQELETDKV